MSVSLADLQALLTLTRKVVADDPAHAPQILSLLMAGGPFRAILQRDDLLDRVTRMARELSQEESPAAPIARRERQPMRRTTPMAHHFRKA